MKTKTVYNPSTCRDEQATVVKCHDCGGTGNTREGTCARCNGHGRHWKTTASWTIPLFSRGTNGGGSYC